MLTVAEAVKFFGFVPGHTEPFVLLFGDDMLVGTNRKLHFADFACLAFYSTLQRCVGHCLPGGSIPLICQRTFGLIRHYAAVDSIPLENKPVLIINNRYVSFHGDDLTDLLMSGPADRNRIAITQSYAFFPPAIAEDAKWEFESWKAGAKRDVFSEIANLKAGAAKPRVVHDGLDDHISRSLGDGTVREGE